MTNNLKRRLKEHNNKLNRSTKPYAPFKIILKEEFQTRINARAREKYLKSGNGREYIKTIINKWPRGATE